MMRKKEYNAPAVRITRLCGLQRMLLSSGQEVVIPSGNAKENSIFNIEESDEEEY